MWPGQLLGEQGEWNRIAHCLISSGGGVKVVAAIVGRQEPVGMLRVAHDRVEVDHRVKMSSGTNPLIHALPVFFAKRAWVVVVRADIGRDGCSEDPKAV